MFPHTCRRDHGVGSLIPHQCFWVIPIQVRSKVTSRPYLMTYAVSFVISLSSNYVIRPFQTHHASNGLFPLNYMYLRWKIIRTLLINKRYNTHTKYQEQYTVGKIISHRIIHTRSAYGLEQQFLHYLGLSKSVFLRQCQIFAYQIQFIVTA